MVYTYTTVNLNFSDTGFQFEGDVICVSGMDVYHSLAERDAGVNWAKCLVQRYKTSCVVSLLLLAVRQINVERPFQVWGMTRVLIETDLENLQQSIWSSNIFSATLSLHYVYIFTSTGTPGIGSGVSSDSSLTSRKKYPVVLVPAQ